MMKKDKKKDKKKKNKRKWLRCFVEWNVVFAFYLSLGCLSTNDM